VRFLKVKLSANNIMKKILISDKLAEAGINFLNEQSGTKIHFETVLNEE